MASEQAGDELAYMPASVLLEYFRARKVSPVEVLQAQIARHEAHNGDVNATTFTHFERALDDARDSEARWMNGTARPLEGISCCLKDEHHKEGMIVTSGSSLLIDNRRDYTDEVTARLKADGCVFHMQTTVPEFYFAGVTTSAQWGVTPSPWNLNYTSGGSSGGTGAALASGFSTIGTGSDMGGSIRIPAAFNGLYGYKPPFGRVSTEGPLAVFSGTGPMARTFGDMVRMQNAISGQTPYAPATLPRVELPVAYPSVAGMRLAYDPTGGGLTPVCPEARAILDSAVARLRDAGAIVDEVPWDLGVTYQELEDMFVVVIWAGSMGGGLEPLKDYSEHMVPYAKWFFDRLQEGVAAGRLRGPDMYAFEQTIRSIHRRMTDQLWSKGYDAAISMTTPLPHTRADYDFVQHEVTIEGQPMGKMFTGALTGTWNFLNYYAVGSAPAGLTSQNMPVGIQFVAPPYRDEVAMRLMHGYERATAPLFWGGPRPDFRR